MTPGDPPPAPLRVAPPTFGPGTAPTGPPSAPPPSVPLTFLVAAGVGLIGLGIALASVASRAVDAPTSPRVVATVHVGLLAFLSTAVLGALHQFAPVVGVRPLRSVPIARVTAAAWVAGAWALPFGFAYGPSWLVPAAGAVAYTGVLLAAWNLSGPLSSRGKGTALTGLRLSVLFLVATASFGIVYAVNRDAGWFPLLPHRVLAHAHLGLLGWLGLTYVAVAEKLWPMFLLAHRPTARSGAWAVRLLATGTVVLVPGLLFGVAPVAAVGGALAVAGLGAHLVSLAGVLRHRRRRLELLHAFVLTAAGSMVVAVGLGAAAGLGSMSSVWRTRLVAAEVAALFGWLTLAVVGHAHKIVPFIAWGVLRGRGITKAPDGRPLLFAHLYDARIARVTFVVTTAGVAGVVAGLVTATSGIVVAGALALSGAAVLALANLGRGPRRVAHARAPAPPVEPSAGTIRMVAEARR
ncbi:MAG: hypothetical protein U0V73_05540 [Acidimicrobiia bacterium]